MIKSRILLPPICLHKGLHGKRFANASAREEKPVEAATAAAESESTRPIQLLLSPLVCTEVDVDGCAQLLWDSYSNEPHQDGAEERFQFN